MLTTIALMIMSGGIAGFMMNRLYVMAAYKAVDVKAQHYEKINGSILLWFFVGSACFGLLFSLGLFALSSAALFRLV